jgi:hypothetical protein
MTSLSGRGKLAGQSRQNAKIKIRKIEISKIAKSQKSKS